MNARTLRKNLRRWIAQPRLQGSFRMLYRLSLAGMNYGGAGSHVSAGDQIALERLTSRGGAAPVVFDVGANVGTYVALARRTLANASIYAFEPSRDAFARLQQSFGATPGVHLINAGAGRADGAATLYSAAPGSVLASTFPNPLETGAFGEPIELFTLDSFCDRRGIRHIDLLKLDVEGGELDALRGASGLLAAGAIASIQFEFGQPSLGARTFFVDLFELLRPHYDIYRVLPHGLELLPTYHETLEVFMATNYLAVARVARTISLGES